MRGINNPPNGTKRKKPMKTTTLKADCYFQQEQYNPRIRATVPPAWVVEFDCALPNTNVPPVFYGHTRREAI